MTISRFVSSTVAASVFLTGIYNLKTNAQPSLNWVEQSLGSYQSQIWAGGDLVSGTTEFRKTSNGYVAGSYTMNEQGELVPGTLSQCQATQERVMRCVWNDPYGTGNLEVTFSPDFSKFYGYWGEENSEPAFRWSGERLSTQSKAITSCQKVNYPIGLNIRSAPSSNSRLIRSVAYGLQVFLDESSRTDSVTVIPSTAQDSDGTTWVKIKAPVQGWVLFTKGEDRDSLIPCQQ